MIRDWWAVRAITGALGGSHTQSFGIAIPLGVVGGLLYYFSLVVSKKKQS